VLALHEVCHAFRQRGFVPGEDFVHLGTGVEQDPARPILVAALIRRDLLEQVRKWPVPEIVEKCRSERLARALGRDPLPIR
jgi:hypothetical protein